MDQLGDGGDRTSSWREHGLYDPASSSAAERLNLLRWIEEQGATLSQMVAAREAGQLVSLGGDLRLRPGPRRTVEETALASVLSVELVKRIRRAGGFPDALEGEPVYTEADLAMFRTFTMAGAFFSSEELLHFVRVVGGSLRRIAEAASEMFMRDVEAGLSEKGTELERAQANLVAIELVQEAVGISSIRCSVRISSSARNRPGERALVRRTTQQRRSPSGSSISMASPPVREP